MLEGVNVGEGLAEAGDVGEGDAEELSEGRPEGDAEDDADGDTEGNRLGLVDKSVMESSNVVSLKNLETKI
jgi:hypothetical protein